MSTLAQQELLDTFHNEAAQWLEILLGLCSKMKELEGKQPTVTWAQQWIEATDILLNDLDNFSERIMFAERYREINSNEIAPVMKQLIDVASTINRITNKMYKIVNNDQYKRIAVARENFVRKHNALLAEKELLIERLATFRKENRRLDKEKKKKLRDCQDRERCKELFMQARESALSEHKKFVASLKAIEAIEHVHIEEDNTIVEANERDECTLVEMTDSRRKRRSRSLGRKALKTVKIAIKRSISAVHSFSDHHHHPKPKESKS